MFRFALILLCCLFHSFLGLAQARYIDQQLFVKFEESITPAELDRLQQANPKWQAAAEQYAFDTLRKAFVTPHASLQTIYVLAYSAQANAADIVAVLEQFPQVDYAERIPDYQFFYTPNDLHPAQWYLQVIDAQGAWDISTGDSAVTIAVIDDAVLLSHPDLADNIWSNPNEIAGNGLDDDLNGYIDDVNGYDVADGDNDPNPPSNASAQYFSHGTHVAALAAGVTDNGQGIASIGFNSTIVPVKIAQDATENIVNAYQGVDYAINLGVDVINMSWGGGAPSQTYQALFDVAYQRDIVCVAAAGNFHSIIPMYPASYDHVISVGATNPSDRIAFFSNYGPTVDVMAPGRNIYSATADPNIPYGIKNGTSMSSPLVAGLVALMQSGCEKLSVDDIEHCLKSTAIPIDSINPSYAGLLGAGRIDAQAALACAYTAELSTVAQPQQICPGSQHTFTVQTSCDVTDILWIFEGGTPDTSGSQQATVRYDTAGIFDVRIAYQNPIGWDTVVYENLVVVDSPSAEISGTYSVIPGGTAYIPVTLAGRSPWTLSWTNGTDTFSQSGITTSPFLLPISVNGTDTVSLVSVTDANCSGGVSGRALLETLASCAGDTIPTETFENTYSDFNQFNAHTINKDQKGNLYISGLYSVSGSDDDYFLSKLDSAGKPIWFNRYDGNRDEFGYPINVNPLDNGQLVLGGRRVSSAILVIDSNGAPVRAFDDPINGPSFSDNYFRRVLQINPNSVFAYAIGTANNNTFGASDIHIAKVNLASGTTAWYNQYGVGGNDHGNNILPADSGRLYIVGTVQSWGTGVRQGLVSLLDSNGNQIWNKAYDIPAIVNFLNAIRDNNHILTIGWADNTSNGDEAIVTKLDLNGNVVWSKTYHLNGNTNGNHIQKAPYGGYIVSGYNISGNTQKLFVMQIDDFGNVNWAKEYGGQLSTSVERHGRNLVVDESGIYIGGHANSSAYLVKADLCGNSGCPTQDISFNVTNRNLRVQQGTFNTRTNNNLQPFTYSQASISIIHDTLCTALTVPDSCTLEASFDSLLACAGDTSLFFSTIDPGAAAYTQWQMGDGTTYTNQDTIAHSYSVPGAYTITLTAFSPIQGCADTLLRTIQIESGFAITGGANDTICQEDSTYLFTPPDLSCGIPPFSYQWSPASGLSSDTLPNPLLDPAGSQLYTLTVTDSLGFTDQALYSITIDSNCCFHDAVVVADDSTLCGSDSTQLSLIGSNLINAHWDFGPRASIDTFTGLIPPKITFDTSGYYPINVIITDSCGLDTLGLFISVFPSPAIDPLRDTSVCRGDTVQLGQPPLSFHEYTWSPSTNLSSTSISNPLAVVQGPITYHLVYTNEQTGCTDSQTVQLDTIPHLIPPFVNDTSLCLQPGSAITSLYPLPNYQWSTGDTTPVVVLSNAGTYWLEATQCVTIRDSFVVDTFPTATLIASDTVTCIGEAVTYSLSSGNWSSINWTFGADAQPPFFQGPTPPPVTYATAGNKSVSVTYNYECGTDVVQFNITVNPLPDTLAFTDVTVCETDTFFYNHVFAGLSFSWTPTTGLLNPQAADPGIIGATAAPVYTVMLTDVSSGCGNTATVTIDVERLPAAPTVIDTSICLGDTALLTAGNLLPGYFWSNGATTATIQVSDTGNYWVANQNSCGITYDTAQVTYRPAPTAFAGNDTTVQYPAEIQLNAQAGGSVLWSPDSAITCLDCIDPIVSPDDTLTYVLQVTDDFGCIAFDSITVYVIKLCEGLQLPNAFTPNGDGLNDELALLGAGGKEELISFRIYNRWGQEVFATTSMQEAWDGNMNDGTAAEVGVYTFVIHYTCDGEVQMESGNVTLIR